VDIAELLHGKAATTTSSSKTLTEAPVSFLPEPSWKEIPEKQRKKLMKQWIAATKFIAPASQLDRILDGAAFLALFLGMYASFRSNPLLLKNMPEQGHWERIVMGYDALGNPMKIWNYVIDRPASYSVDENLCLGASAALGAATYLARDNPSAMAIPLTTIAANLFSNVAAKTLENIF